MMADRSALLERIARSHPEWLEPSVPLATPRDASSDHFVLRLASIDRRPDVEVELERHEALVRTGRHERLFVWPSTDAEAAAEEVLAYIERITRSDLSHDRVRRETETLSDEQRELLGRIDALLRACGAVSDVRARGPLREPSAELILLLPPERRLDVKIRIAPDTFELDANRAVLRLCRIDFGDDGPVWIEACASTLEALLRHDLELRLRRTLLGGRVGAVRVPSSDGHDVWNGDALAVHGWGRTRRIPRWWSAE